MEIRESDIFISQIFNLSKSPSFSKINQDINNFKKEFDKICFKNLGPLNTPLFELPIPNISESCKEIIWRARVINSDNNKGKRAGYRVFYCRGNGKYVAIFLGVFPKPEIEKQNYRKIAKELVSALKQKDWE